MYYGGSFQVPVLEDQHRSADGHGRIEQRIERVVKNQLRRHRLLMSDGADHVEGGKIGYQISSAAGQPSRESMGHPGKPAQVLGKASDHEQGESEDRGEQWRRK